MKGCVNGRGGFLSILLFILLFVQTSVSRGETGETVEVFAYGYEDNLRKILTWSGKARVEVFEYRGKKPADWPPNSVWREEIRFIAEVQFYKDRQANQLRYDWKELPPDNGAENGVSKAGDGDLKAIVNNEQGIEFWNNRLYGVTYGEHTYAAKRVTIQEAKDFKRYFSPFSQYFDPDFYLTIMQRPTSNRLRNLLKDGAVRPEYEIQYTPPLLRISCEESDKPKRYAEMVVLDKNKGFNVIEYRISKSGDIDNSFTCTYKEVANGVWLPEEYSYTHFDYLKKNDGPTATRRVRFIAHELNAGLDPSLFELKSLDLGEKCFIENKIQGITYPANPDIALDEIANASPRSMDKPTTATKKQSSDLVARRIKPVEDRTTTKLNGEVQSRSDATDIPKERKKTVFGVLHVIGGLGVVALIVILLVSIHGRRTTR